MGFYYYLASPQTVEQIYTRSIELQNMNSTGESNYCGFSASPTLWKEQLSEFSVFPSAFHLYIPLDTGVVYCI